MTKTGAIAADRANFGFIRRIDSVDGVSDPVIGTGTFYASSDWQAVRYGTVIIVSDQRVRSGETIGPLKEIAF